MEHFNDDLLCDDLLSLLLKFQETRDKNNQSIDYVMELLDIRSQFSDIGFKLATVFNELINKAEINNSRYNVNFSSHENKFLNQKDQSGKHYSATKAKSLAKSINIEEYVLSKELFTKANGLKLYIDRIKAYESLINQMVSTINKNF